MWEFLVIPSMEYVAEGGRQEDIVQAGSWSRH